MQSVAPSSVTPNANGVRRTLLIIGGAEDRIGRSVVLKRFVKLAGGRRSHIVLIPTASSYAPAPGRSRSRGRAGDAHGARTQCVRAPVGWCGVRQAPTSKRAKRVTVVPAASRTALTVFLDSVTDSCSSRTISL